MPSDSVRIGRSGDAVDFGKRDTLTSLQEWPEGFVDDVQKTNHCALSLDSAVQSILFNGVTGILGSHSAFCGLCDTALS